MSELTTEQVKEWLQKIDTKFAYECEQVFLSHELLRTSLLAERERADAAEIRNGIMMETIRQHPAVLARLATLEKTERERDALRAKLEQAESEAAALLIAIKELHGEAYIEASPKVAARLLARLKGMQEALEKVVSNYEDVYDCVDNNGKRYQSQSAADAIALARKALQEKPV